MKSNFSVTEVSRNFSEFINRVAYNGERFVLMRGKKAVAELAPVNAGKKISELPELFLSLPHLSKKELEDFAKDLEDSREKMRNEKPRDVWAF